MRTEDLQMVETHGDAIERARQFGEATREGLKAYLALTEPSLRCFASPRGQALKGNLVEHFYRLDPPMELVEAFCEAAGASAETMIERAASFSAGKSKLDTECSGVVLRKAGRVLIGQNLDTGTECGEANFLEIGRGPDTRGYARFCWPFVLSCMHGINIHGVANGGCSGPVGDPMGEGKGLPALLSRWLYFYRCRTPADVAKAMRRYRVVGKGSNNVFADAGGEIVKTEQGGGGFGLHYPTEDWCVATGHRPHIRGEGLGDNPPAKKAADKARWDRLNLLAEQALDTPADPVDDLKRMLADHETADGHPESAPCRHGETSSTQFSFIYDLTNRVVHYCGQPCCNEWRRVGL